MQSRKDLIREYKERQKPAGVFQIKNTKTGKFLLASSLNIEGSLNKHKFMLKTGGHINKALQADWNRDGAENFVFEILEEVKVQDEAGFKIEDELGLLEEIWIEELKPFDGENYNYQKKIREA